LAAVYEAKGEFAKAHSYYERAVEARSGSVRPADSAERIELARFHLRRGSFGEAGRLLEEQPEETGPGYSAFLLARGQLGIAEGRFDLAVEWYRKALQVQLDRFGSAHPEIIDTKLGMAKAFFSAGNNGESFGAALEAEGLSRDLLRLTAQGLSEREALRFADTRRSGLDLAISSAFRRQSRERTKKLWDAVVRSRALVFDEMAGRMHDIHSAKDAVTSEKIVQLSELGGQLANLALREADDLPKEYAELVESVRKKKEELERDLGQSGLRLRSGSEELVGFEDVSEALPPGTALVAFVRFEDFNRPIDKGSRQGDPEFPFSYLALVLRDRPNSEPLMVDLGDAGEIENAVARWRAWAVDPGSSSSEESESPVTYGTALRETVWDPLADHLDGAEVVYLVPEGPLHTVNFAALPFSDGSYLVEKGPIIQYLAVERDLANQGSPAPQRNRLLAFAAPAFDDRPTGPSTPAEGLELQTRSSEVQCRSFQNLRFGPLNEALQEGKEVTEHWISGAEEQEATLITGRDATEAQLRRLAGEYGVLHLATHGFFLTDTCSTVNLGSATRGVGKVSFMKPPGSGFKIGENPLLLSGLAFAGANQRTSEASGVNDGILTAAEIAGLNLDGVRLAVLSACDTGLGGVQTGEGILGLNRAFRMAGVESLVLSLWPVQDRLARDWSRLFYASYLEHDRNVARAVHETNLALLKERRDQGQSTNPTHWAAFIASGASQ
jgi:CHAT domain-containing protein